MESGPLGQGSLLPELTLKVVGCELLKEANSFIHRLQKEINCSLQMDISNFILFTLKGNGYLDLILEKLFCSKFLYPKWCFWGNTGWTEAKTKGMPSVPKLQKRVDLGVWQETWCSAKSVWALLLICFVWLLVSYFSEPHFFICKPEIISIVHYQRIIIRLNWRYVMVVCCRQ